MRLVTLNTWGTRGDWPRRREAMRAGFAALDADVITLQETIVSDGFDQARDVLGDGYALVHQRHREADGQGITTASRYPFGETFEVDWPRTAGFASTCLVTQILAPEPVWVANHLPDWQLDHEHERELQTVAAARRLNELQGHVIVAGDFDADPQATSVRFWTGRHALDGLSVCYRDAWEARHPDEPGHTFVPENPYSADWDWPFRRIDYILVRCGEHGGPTLRIDRCDRVFDGPDTVSDHYGLLADLSGA
jgi:endonuclease/exonuclease/phosphatase family metal-dependent hydrolase